jgi:F-type H+-transporting ATPase subunit delta
VISGSIARRYARALLDIAATQGSFEALGREIGDLARTLQAQALTPLQETKIRKALETLSGKQVLLDRRQDAELLGGVVAQLGDVVYDGSLRTQLERMRESLVK